MNGDSVDADLRATCENRPAGGVDLLVGEAATAVVLVNQPEIGSTSTLASLSIAAHPW